MLIRCLALKDFRFLAIAQIVLFILAIIYMHLYALSLLFFFQINNTLNILYSY